jgi:hypothetical protein
MHPKLEALRQDNPGGPPRIAYDVADTTLTRGLLATRPFAVVLVGNGDLQITQVRPTDLANVAVTVAPDGSSRVQFESFSDGDSLGVDTFYYGGDGEPIAQMISDIRHHFATTQEELDALGPLADQMARGIAAYADQLEPGRIDDEPEAPEPRKAATKAAVKRAREAFALLCRGKPPKALVRAWMDDDEGEDGENYIELQAWALNHARLPWAQGITIVEAAVALAEEPQDTIEGD